MFKRHLLAFALALCVSPAIAQHGPKPVPADAATRKAVIAELSSQLKANYVFPEVADKLAVALAAKEASGAYAQATDSKAFADVLTNDLRAIGKDGHFFVGYDPGFRPAPANAVPDAATLEAMRREIASHGFGIDSVRRLPGNVGYLELRGFGPTAMVGPAISGAMTMLSGTDALILDLRRNGGGEPETVAYLMSHFFAQGDERHLNDLYFRNGDTTRQYWTSATVGPRYTRPVYVLTSGRTFSGGEECAYDFQTQKRAKIVGEKTGGGANPGDGYAIGNGYAAFIPNGRAINPVTGTNWEHVGVTPDIAVPAADAQKVAHAAILRDLIAATKNPDEKTALQDSLKDVESGKVEVPVYTKR
ncbi:MAG TPA: S41 family peptidase [Thermomonas sp.]|nr:S41 family peptidase [Thermomonas sp.]